MGKQREKVELPGAAAGVGVVAMQGAAREGRSAGGGGDGAWWGRGAAGESLCKLLRCCWCRWRALLAVVKCSAAAGVVEGVAGSSSWSVTQGSGGGAAAGVVAAWKEEEHVGAGAAAVQLLLGRRRGAALLSSQGQEENRAPFWVTLSLNTTVGTLVSHSKYIYSTPKLLQGYGESDGGAWRLERLQGAWRRAALLQLLVLAASRRTTELRVTLVAARRAGREGGKS